MNLLPFFSLLSPSMHRNPNMPTVIGKKKLKLLWTPACEEAQNFNIKSMVHCYSFSAVVDYIRCGMASSLYNLTFLITGNIYHKLHVVNTQCILHPNDYILLPFSEKCYFNHYRTWTSKTSDHFLIKANRFWLIRSLAACKWSSN